MATFTCHLLLFLLVHSLLTAATAAQSISPASLETLSDVGYVSMALTLQLASQTLIPASTVFAPSDDAFSGSGQPPLSLLQYHISPAKLPVEALKSLHFGARIPTLAPNRSLVVTSQHSDALVSINGVAINGLSPVYDDGKVIIYGIGRFFDPGFEISPPTAAEGCPAGVALGQFDGAVSAMGQRGFSTMSAFLSMQLGREPAAAMTVFAPEDSVLGDCNGDFREFAFVLRAHVVPCRLTSEELGKLADGAALPTFLDGFTIAVERSNGLVALNGVPIYVVDMYQDESLVVHGVHQLLKTLDSVGFDIGDGQS